MMVKDFREFIFEIYYERIGLTKEDSYYSLKKQKKKTKKRFSITCYQVNEKIYLVLLKLKKSMNYF